MRGPDSSLLLERGMVLRMMIPYEEHRKVVIPCALYELECVGYGLVRTLAGQAAVYEVVEHIHYDEQ